MHYVKLSAPDTAAGDENSPYKVVNPLPLLVVELMCRQTFVLHMSACKECSDSWLNSGSSSKGIMEKPGQFGGRHDKLTANQKPFCHCLGH